MWKLYSEKLYNYSIFEADNERLPISQKFPVINWQQDIHKKHRSICSNVFQDSIKNSVNPIYSYWLTRKICNLKF